MFRREVRIRFARPGFENPLREDRLPEAGAGRSPIRDTICRCRETNEFAAARCRGRISAISLLFLTKCVHRKQRRDVMGDLSGFTAFLQGCGAEVRPGACRAGCSFGKCGAKRRECGRSVRGKRATEFVRRAGYRFPGRPYRGASPANVRSTGRGRKIVFLLKLFRRQRRRAVRRRGNGECSAGILSGRGTNDRSPEQAQGCMLRRAQPCDTVCTGQYGGNHNSSSPRSTSATIRSICCQTVSGNVVPVTSITLPAAMAPIVPHCFIESPLQRPERNPAA